MLDGTVTQPYSSHRPLTDEEKSEGWVFAGFWPAEECGLGAPKGEYRHLGNDFYAYRGPSAERFADEKV